MLKKLGKLSFAFGRDAAKTLEKAKQLRDAGEFQAAVDLLSQPLPEPPKHVDPIEYETRHHGRLVRAECLAEIGIRSGRSALAREGIRTLVTLPAVNVNSLRDSALRWPEKLARAEEFLTTMLAPDWNRNGDKSELLPELQTLASGWNLLRDPAAARRVCLKAAAALGDVPALLVLQAEAELGLGAHREALDCLARTIRGGAPLDSSNLALAVLGDIQGLGDPTLANEAEVLTGELLGRLESWGRALPILQKAVEERFDDAGIPAVEALLIACARSRHLAEFETLTERFLNRPLPPKSLGRLEQEVVDALGKYSDRTRLRGILGILRIRAGRLAEGLADLVSAVKSTPATIDALVKLLCVHSEATAPPADLLLQLTEHLLAADFLDGCPAALTHFGSVQATDDQTDHAIRLAREICSRRPDLVGARVALAGLMLRRNRFEDVIAASPDRLLDAILPPQLAATLVSAPAPAPPLAAPESSTPGPEPTSAPLPAPDSAPHSDGDAGPLPTLDTSPHAAPIPEPSPTCRLPELPDPESPAATQPPPEAPLPAACPPPASSASTGAEFLHPRLLENLRFNPISTARGCGGSGNRVPGPDATTGGPHDDPPEFDSLVGRGFAAYRSGDHTTARRCWEAAQRLRGGDRLLEHTLRLVE